jgi:hypothetical protein
VIGNWSCIHCDKLIFECTLRISSKQFIVCSVHLFHSTNNNIIYNSFLLTKESYRIVNK